MLRLHKFYQTTFSVFFGICFFGGQDNQENAVYLTKSSFYDSYDIFYYYMVIFKVNFEEKNLFRPKNYFLSHGGMSRQGMRFQVYFDNKYGLNKVNFIKITVLNRCFVIHPKIHQDRMHQHRLHNRHMSVFISPVLYL